MPFSDDSLDTLAELLASDWMPPEALDLEGIDGILTAWVVGPKQVTFEQIFPYLFDVDGQNLPQWPNAEVQTQTTNLLKQYADSIHSYLAIDPNKLNDDNVYQPLVLEVPEEMAAQATENLADDDEVAPGWWPGRSWALGFLRLVETLPEWSKLLENPKDNDPDIVPAVFLFTGVLPPELDIEFDEDEWISALSEMSYELYHYWQTK